MGFSSSSGPVGKTVSTTSTAKSIPINLSTQDRTINPDLQRFMAKRMGANLALISHPDAITKQILAALTV
jgi:hypothetical protein